MVKERQKETGAKPSSKPSPPPKRETRLQAAKNAAPDKTTSTNRQNASSAPKATKTTLKAAEKKTAANITKSRWDPKPADDEKPAESDEPQPVKSRKRKAELKENSEDLKVSKKQRLAEDNDQKDEHRRIASRGDTQNANGSKSAATNPLLSTLNAATAQGARDLKATKRSYIRQNEEDSSAVPSHDGRFTTPFPSEPPRSDHDDSGNKRQAYQDELQKLEVETRRRDSQAKKSQRRRRKDERSHDAETGPVETATKSPQHLSSTADDEISHDETTARQPPDISSTAGKVGTQPAAPVATDDTSIRQSPETQTTPVLHKPYPSILEMDPETAFNHLDIFIRALVAKVFASQSPDSLSLVSINPSRELERLYQIALGKDWKTAARLLHERACLPAASLLRSLIWSCLFQYILNADVNLPWHSPHRTGELLETYFPLPDKDVTTLKCALRTISVRFMKTEKFLNEVLPMHTHALVHQMYFSLVEHLSRVGGRWQGQLRNVCEAALLLKGICKASDENVRLFWYRTKDSFDGKRMEAKQEEKGGDDEEVEVAFTMRPGLDVRDRESGKEVRLLRAQVTLMRKGESDENDR